MTIKGVEHSFLYNNANKNESHEAAGVSFGESFQGNLVRKQRETEAVSESNKNVESIRYAHSASKVQVREVLNAGSAREVTVRNLSYLESDHAMVNLQEGYAMKAQVDVSKGVVYVEIKIEDGEVYGYEVKISDLDKNTQNPIERMALESWEKNEALSNSETGRDIIDMTDKAWKKFMERIDDAIEYFKENAEDAEEKSDSKGEQ